MSTTASYRKLKIGHQFLHYAPATRRIRQGFHVFISSCSTKKRRRALSLSYFINTGICTVYLHLLLTRYSYSRILSKYAGEDAPKAPGTSSAAEQAPKQAPKTPPPSETPPASSSCYLRK